MFVVYGDHVLEFALFVKLTVVNNDLALVLRDLEVLDISKIKSSYAPAFRWVSEIVHQLQSDSMAIFCALGNDVAVIRSCLNSMVHH